MMAGTPMQRSLWPYSPSSRQEQEKTLAMESGVNFTAGLPYVRTSPDHGTGYDIAGKGVASEASMRAALYAAIDIFRSRRTHEEMTASPLPKLYHERGRDNVVLDLTKDR